MANQLNEVPASLEPIGTAGKASMLVSPVWYKFFVSLSNILSGGGSGGGASLLLDTIGSTVGGMLSRFGSGWQEFVASGPNQIPVMNPAAPVSLRTVSQLLDSLGAATRGMILYRGAVSWQLLAPSNGNFLQSLGVGADPIYSQPDIDLLLDTLGAVHGNVLFRGALGWQTLAPVADGLLQSHGVGADPTYVTNAAFVPSVATGLVATGTVQADALVLTDGWNEVATVAAGTGVVIPDLDTGIASKVWNNDAANALLVYPPVGGQIDALGVDIAYSLPFAKSQVFSQTAALQWFSTQLG